jgi:hypothetical protein
VKASQIVFYLTKAVCSKVSNGFFFETSVFALLHVAKSQMVFISYHTRIDYAVDGIPNILESDLVWGQEPTWSNSFDL